MTDLYPQTDLNPQIESWPRDNWLNVDMIAQRLDLPGAFVIIFYDHSVCLWWSYYGDVLFWSGDKSVVGFLQKLAPPTINTPEEVN